MKKNKTLFRLGLYFILFSLFFNLNNIIIKATNFSETHTNQDNDLDIEFDEDNEFDEGSTNDVYTINKVTNLKVISNGLTTITISWDKQEHVDGYNIFRYDPIEDIYLYLGDTQATTFKDTELQPGHNYFYLVNAYIDSPYDEGEDSDLVEGYTELNKAYPTYKGGDNKARISWPTVTNADSYDLYYQEKGYEISYLATVKNSSKNSYELTNLSRNKTYYFYIVANREYDNETYLGPSSDPLTIKLKKLAKTSTKPKLFPTLKAFKKSDAYKKLKSVKTLPVLSKSFTLPGLTTTNVAGYSSTLMTPQGITFAKDYILLTAHDKGKEENSVIYALDKKTKKLLTTLVLSNKDHVGDITFDGVNVWISNYRSMSVILYSDLDEAIKRGGEYQTIDYHKNIKLNMSTSYMTYYDGLLWIGSYNELQETQMHSYYIESKRNDPTLLQKDTMKMPTRVQGVAFTKNGEMILSRSCQLYQGLRGYMSQIDTYTPDFDNVVDNIISRGPVQNTTPMPSMNEAIAISGTNLYISFESGAFYNASYPVDRVLTFKLRDILGQ